VSHPARLQDGQGYKTSTGRSGHVRLL